ncbi:MAG: hypothetical protein NUW21_08145 [Elusimicrobia bacterium]|nr:hypothetical protein [Elusimicrobiota bacterium]
MPRKHCCAVIVRAGKPRECWGRPSAMSPGGLWCVAHDPGRGIRVRAQATAKAWLGWLEDWGGETERDERENNLAELLVRFHRRASASEGWK